MNTPEDARIKLLEYHIESGDYLRVLATVFGFVEEDMIPPASARKLREELRYIADRYTIVPQYDSPKL